MVECVFCKIVKGLEPCYKVYEDENTMAFPPLKEDIISKRQLLLIPKKHYVSIYDMPEKEMESIMKATKSIALKLKKKYGADGINILHASGKVAQQSVFHFHFHLLPRYSNDGLDAWPNTGYKEREYPQIYEDMKNL